VGLKAPVGPNTQEESTLNHWLDIAAKPRVAAAIAVCAFVLTVVSVLETASISWVSTAAPLAFGLLSWLAYRRGKRGIAVFMAILIAVSAAFVVRAYATPPTASFFYDGSPMGALDPDSPFANQNGIPLTDEPSQGRIITTIYSGEVVTFGVTCVITGVFDRGHIPVDWAYISTGNYQTLWIPRAYIYGMAFGTANTLLPCSDWRWQLHNFGKPRALLDVS
jgi:hypothetical protein